MRPIAALLLLTACAPASGTDAGPQVTADAGVDAGVDAGPTPDAGLDAGVDAGPICPSTAHAIETCLLFADSGFPYRGDVQTAVSVVAVTDAPEGACALIDRERQGFDPSRQLLLQDAAGEQWIAVTRGLTSSITAGRAMTLTATGRTKQNFVFSREQSFVLTDDAGVVAFANRESDTLSFGVLSDAGITVTDQGVICSRTFLLCTWDTHRLKLALDGQSVTLDQGSASTLGPLTVGLEAAYVKTGTNNCDSPGDTYFGGVRK